MPTQKTMHKITISAIFDFLPILLMFHLGNIITLIARKINANVTPKKSNVLVFPT